MLDCNKKAVYYSTKNHLTVDTPHTIALYPFWENNDKDVNDPDFGRFDSFCASANEFMAITSDPEASDAFLLPFEYQFSEPHINASKKMAKDAFLFNKKLIVFYNSDDSSAIDIDNALIFRTSFFKSTRKINEFALPGWSMDFNKINPEKTKPLAKSKQPEISYCGYVDNLKLNLKSRIRNFISKYQPIKETEIGRLLRGQHIRKLLKDNRISTKFIIREGFWAPNISKQDARQEYFNNVTSCPYALVIRGAGNFSYRLYEVMSAGRIPVFVNTDCVLPFEEFIDWKKYCVWIENTDDLAQKLVDFHKNTSEKDFIKLQENIRILYEEWISPIGFFKNIHRYI